MKDLSPDYYVKPRTVDHPVHELVHNRWSPVIFSSAPVEPEKLDSLFEAARWAPSCYNEQPWSFILGIEPDHHAAVLSTLVDANKEWAQHAPVLGISVARLNFSKNGKPNREAQHDVGLAMGQLCIQAVDLELSVHQMAGFDPDKARELFNIPDDHRPMAAFAIGYMADPKLCDNEALRQREETIGTRKPVTDFVFTGRWG